MEVKMKADDKQISGNHYKEMSIQPWTYVHANNLGYFEGSAIKYITRWRSKGGIADIQKAIHFLEKLIELESASKSSAPSHNPVVMGAISGASGCTQGLAVGLHPSPSMASSVGDTYRPTSEFWQELIKVTDQWVMGKQERDTFHGG